MFSEELEMLIEAAIADGEISEKERSVLHKRAQAEGVDTDELDMIVDARIAKAKKAAAEEAEYWADEEEEENKESTLKKFTKKLEEINNTKFKGSFLGLNADEKKAEAIQNAVNAIYVPNKKDELLELIAYFKPLSKGGSGYGWLDKTYKAKYNEICQRTQSLFPNDEDIELAINGPKKEKKGFFGFGKKS